MPWTSARRLAAAATNAATRGSREPAPDAGASLTLKPTSVSLGGSSARSVAHCASSLSFRAFSAAARSAAVSASIAASGFSFVSARVNLA